MLTEIKPGTLVDNRYLIKKFLGQGGFGRTYLAFDTQRFEEPCVLKEFISANSKTEILQRYRDFFEREARILYQIEHPQIPKFKAWFTAKKRLFIVQEFIDGKTYSKILSERLTRQQQPFYENEIRTWLSELLPVLDYIHGQHIIHRDISLENVMFCKQKRKPILIDFGVVKEKFTQFFAVDSDYQQIRGSVVGKIGYSPPEQLRMGYCYPCSDIYALGVSAIVLLTGRRPSMLLNQSLEWHWESYTKLSDSLNRILRKMLAEKPTERYQSAQEILAELHPHRANLNTSLVTKQVNNYEINSQHHTFQKQEVGQSTRLQKIEPNFRVTGADKIINQLESKQIESKQIETKQITSISQNFVDYCQQELTSFVGPFASVLVQHTLECTPQITPDELMEVLTKAITQPERAREFKSRVQNSLRAQSKSNYSDLSTQLDEKFIEGQNIFSVKFIEDCRRELTSFVGPFASIIIDDLLREQDTLTQQELIENLIAQIPDPERAENFKKRIEKFY